MANYYVTVSGAGLKDGSDWDNAFGLSEFETSIEGSISAGDTYFIKEGTYNLASTINATTAGAIDLPISIVGVVSGTIATPPTSSDWATGTNRPIFNGGSSYYFKVGNYYQILNIRFTGAYSVDTLNIGTYGFCYNCRMESTYASSSGQACSATTNTVFVSCEFVAANCSGLYSNGIIRLIYCYFHDSTLGLEIASTVEVCLYSCIIDTCTTGMNAGARPIILNLTLYNCTTGIYDTGGCYFLTMLNSNISSCIDGFKSNNAGTINRLFFLDYNNWYNNTRDMSWDNGVTEDNSVKGSNALIVNPNFIDAANGDFSLSTGSALIGSGLGITLGVG